MNPEHPEHPEKPEPIRIKIVWFCVFCFLLSKFVRDKECIHRPTDNTFLLFAFYQIKP